jgi:aspartyl-tRNA(Asn)/glutamyl-tRNA(Gln) amidotransferase subunit C
MAVERKVVEHVAKLARLRLEEEELERHRLHLGAVLDYVAQLQKVDVRGLEPLAHPAESADVFRDDVPRPCLGPDAALANAPEKADGFFVVPKVVE